MDFIGPLKRDEDDKACYVLVIIDGFSRYALLSANIGPDSKASMRGLRRWMDRLGSPARIVSDNGPAIKSKKFKELTSSSNIKHLTIAPYAHWSNGIVERCNQTVLERIKREGPKKTWASLIKKVENIYNDSYHTGIGATPRMVMQGIKPRGFKLSKDQWLQTIQKAEMITKRTQRNMIRRQLRRLPKKTRCHLPFREQDKVMSQIEVRNKLSPEWQGPHTIIKRLGSRLFHIDWMDSGTLVGPVHAHQLKRIY